MSEYVKIKRRVYDELCDNNAKYKALKAKYEVLHKTLEAMLNVCDEQSEEIEKDCADLPVW